MTATVLHSDLVYEAGHARSDDETHTYSVTAPEEGGSTWDRSTGTGRDEVIGPEERLVATRFGGTGRWGTARRC